MLMYIVYKRHTMTMDKPKGNGQGNGAGHVYGVWSRTKNRSWGGWQFC